MEANVAIEPNNSNKQSQNIDETTTERTTRVTDDHHELGVARKYKKWIETRITKMKTWMLMITTNCLCLAVP